MISSIGITSLFNIHQIMNIEQSSDKVKILGKVKHYYIILKIDIREDQSIKTIRSFEYSYFSDAKKAYDNCFKNWNE